MYIYILWYIYISVCVCFFFGQGRILAIDPSQKHNCGDVAQRAVTKRGVTYNCTGTLHVSLSQVLKMNSRNFFLFSACWWGDRSNDFTTWPTISTWYTPIFTNGWNLEICFLGSKGKHRHKLSSFRFQPFRKVYETLTRVLKGPGVFNGSG